MFSCAYLGMYLHVLLSGLPVILNLPPPCVAAVVVMLGSVLPPPGGEQQYTSSQYSRSQKWTSGGQGPGGTLGVTERREREFQVQEFTTKKSGWGKVAARMC